MVIAIAFKNNLLPSMLKKSERKSAGNSQTLPSSNNILETEIVSNFSKEYNIIGSLNREINNQVSNLPQTPSDQASMHTIHCCVNYLYWFQLWIFQACKSWEQHDNEKHLEYHLIWWSLLLPVTKHYQSIYKTNITNIIPLRWQHVFLFSQVLLISRNWFPVIR